VPAGYLIDVQGTLIDDRERRPIRGAVETIAALRRRNIPFVLVTNNTKEPSEAFKTYLRGLGFDFEEGQYLDPLMVLGERLPPCTVAAYGSPAFWRASKRWDTGSTKAVRKPY
jgi:NagD protein